MYDLLYKNQEVKEVRLDEYLDNVISAIPLNNTIVINKQMSPIILSVKDAISVGIITAEIFTNTIKYAYPKNEKGEISVLLKKESDTVIINISDNGIGIPENFDIQTSQSLGLKLVRDLAKQLGGTFSIKNNNGTKCRIEFKQ